MKTYISALIVVIAYFGGASIALRFYLPEIIFKKSKDVISSEDHRYKVHVGEDEILIRQYGPSLNGRCAIFFPGQHGGVLRYEKEIFGNLTNNGVTVLSLSYPGYEGAYGSADYSSILETSKLAFAKIEEQTSCKIKSSVFVGRSLGASVALEVAKYIRPKGIVLDSLALSLAESVRGKLKNSVITAPLNLLPIEKLISFNVSSKDALVDLSNIRIIVFQGRADKVTPLQDIEPLLKSYDNVTLNIIDTASHKNTYVLAGDKYINAILELL